MIVRLNRSAAEVGYAASLQRAYSAGFNAAADEREGHPPVCQYRRYEHRKSWTDGLRDGRALQNAPKPEVAAEGAPSMAGSGRPSPNPSEPRT